MNSLTETLCFPILESPIFVKSRKNVHPHSNKIGSSNFEPVPVETSRDFEEKRGTTRGLIMGVELWTKGYSL